MSHSIKPLSGASSISQNAASGFRSQATASLNNSGNESCRFFVFKIPKGIRCFLQTHVVKYANETRGGSLQTDSESHSVDSVSGSRTGAHHVRSHPQKEDLSNQ